MELYNAGKYDEAIAAFKELDGYKDSANQIKNCEEAIETELKEQKYNNAVSLYEAGKYSEAITEFKALGTFRDSKAYLYHCET